MSPNLPAEQLPLPPTLPEHHHPTLIQDPSLTHVLGVVSSDHRTGSPTFTINPILQAPLSTSSPPSNKGKLFPNSIQTQPIYPALTSEAIQNINGGQTRGPSTKQVPITQSNLHSNQHSNPNQPQLASTSLFLLSDFFLDREFFEDAPLILPASIEPSRPSSPISENGTSLALRVFDQISGALSQWRSSDLQSLEHQHSGDLSMRDIHTSARMH